MGEQITAIKNPVKPFTVIFLIELWERFGYYGVQALLVMFLVKSMNFSDAQADSLFGAFSALVFSFISIGGFIGDKVLGTKRTVLLGAIFLAGAYGLLSINTEKYLYLGLGAIIAGNTLFKSNPCSLVSKLYAPGDHRIDGAFTIYYMAINVGSFLSMVLCPVIKKYFGWEYGFLVCCIGLVFTIIVYLIFNKWLKDIGSEPDFAPIKLHYLLMVIIGSILLIFISALLLKHLTITHWLLSLSFAVIFFVLVKIFFKLKTEERGRFVVCIVLVSEAILFYILYQQMPTSLTLFALRNTNHSLFGIMLEPESFQALNPLWVLILSPVLAFVYIRLGKKGKDFSIPGKFAFGMFLCACSFLLLKLAAMFFADSNGIVSGNWLLLSYGLQSTGELLIGGLGLAMVCRLIPQRMMGFMMGIWYVCMAVAMVLGGYVASFAAIPQDITNPVLTLPIYANLFLKIGVASFGIGIIMSLFVPILKRYFVKEA